MKISQILMKIMLFSMLLAPAQSYAMGSFLAPFAASVHSYAKYVILTPLVTKSTSKNGRIVVGAFALIGLGCWLANSIKEQFENALHQRNLSQLKLVRYLVTDRYKLEMLNTGICKNYINAVEILLQSGVSANLCIPKGFECYPIFTQRSLILATEIGSAAMVELLLKYGANPNLQNEDGLTALMRAISIENVELVKLLLQSGADVRIKDIKSLTAYDYALRISNNEMRQAIGDLLEARMKKHRDYLTHMLAKVPGVQLPPEMHNYIAQYIFPKCVDSPRNLLVGKLLMRLSPMKFIHVIRLTP